MSLFDLMIWPIYLLLVLSLCVISLRSICWFSRALNLTPQNESKKNRGREPIHHGHQATSSMSANAKGSSSHAVNTQQRETPDAVVKNNSSTHSQETPMTVYANEQKWPSLSNDKTPSTKSSNRASASLEPEMSRDGLDSIAGSACRPYGTSHDTLRRGESLKNRTDQATGQRSRDILKNVVPQLKETSVNDRSGDTQSVSVTPKIEQANSVGHKDSDYTGYELPQSRTSEKRESDKRSSNNPDGNFESAESRDLLHRWVHWEPHAGYEAILNTDGSLTDATGKWGAVIRRRDGMVLAAAHGTSRFNNIGFIEMEALFKGLSLALGKGLTSLEACTDSMAVIHNLECNDPPWEISRTLKKIKNMCQHFTKLWIHHVYREANQLADRIAACSPALAYVEIIPSSFSEDLKKIVFEDSIGKKHLRVYELPQSRTSEKRESDKCSSNNTDENCDKHIDICPVKSGVPKLKISLLDRNNEKRKDLERTTHPIHLRPGMVLLKNFISLADQIKIIKKCRELGLGSGGFYKPGYDDGAKLRLHMMCLGKNWDPQSRSYEEIRSVDGAKPPIIPNEFRKLVSDAIQASRQGDRVRKPSEDIPLMEPDICIVNFYTNTGKLGLHQDRDESPESLKRGSPVVSFSIGDSAEFLYGDERDEDKAEKVELKSGDVLIFGGKSRLIYHGVPSITPNSAPKFLADEANFRPGRLNLTFRKY